MYTADHDRNPRTDEQIVVNETDAKGGIGKVHVLTILIVSVTLTVIALWAAGVIT